MFGASLIPNDMDLVQPNYFRRNKNFKFALKVLLIGSFPFRNPYQNLDVFFWLGNGVLPIAPHLSLFLAAVFTVDHFLSTASSATRLFATTASSLLLSAASSGSRFLSAASSATCLFLATCLLPLLGGGLRRQPFPLRRLLDDLPLRRGGLLPLLVSGLRRRPLPLCRLFGSPPVPTGRGTGRQDRRATN